MRLCSSCSLRKNETLTYHVCIEDYDTYRVEVERVCNKRGGHPISTIYWYAHSPYQEVEFVIEDEHVLVAEFICNLA